MGVCKTPDRGPVARRDGLKAAADYGGLALASASWSKGERHMDEVKQGYREVENKTKEAWRQADGDESIADKVGNVGDDVRDGVGNLADDIRRGVEGVDDDVKDTVDQRH
jgi:gas vesicle protein